MTSHFTKEKREGGNTSDCYVSSHHLTMLKMEKEMMICFAVVRLAPTWKEKKNLVMKGDD